MAPPSSSDSKKSNKVGSLLNNLFGPADTIRARTWEAKSAHVLELEREQRELERQKIKDEHDLRTLENLVENMKFASEKQALSAELADTRKASLDRQEKMKKAIEEIRARRAGEAAKKKEEEALSLADQERHARLELEAQKLQLQKIVSVQCVKVFISGTTDWPCLPKPESTSPRLLRMMRPPYSTSPAAKRCAKSLQRCRTSSKRWAWEHRSSRRTSFSDYIDATILCTTICCTATSMVS